MAVNEIHGNPLPVDPLRQKDGKSEKGSKTSAKDKVELSDEARSLFNATHAQKVEDTKEKIRSGFYFRRDVLEKVADLVLKELRKPVE
jgi:anti-sigma28 factor (negative regulator of flagellin synthesis)